MTFTDTVYGVLIRRDDGTCGLALGSEGRATFFRRKDAVKFKRDLAALLLTSRPKKVVKVKAEYTIL